MSFDLLGEYYNEDLGWEQPFPSLSYTQSEDIDSEPLILENPRQIFRISNYSKSSFDKSFLFHNKVRNCPRKATKEKKKPIFKLSEKSKAILKEKRERAKRREQLKKNTEGFKLSSFKEPVLSQHSEESTESTTNEISSTSAEKVESVQSMPTTSNNEVPVKSKFEQKLRNRISAQLSRDKRKVYVDSLELKNGSLLKENKFLKMEVDYYKQMIAKCVSCSQRSCSSSFQSYNPNQSSTNGGQDPKLNYDQRVPGNSKNAFRFFPPMFVMICLSMFLFIKSFADFSSSGSISLNKNSFNYYLEQTSKIIDEEPRMAMNMYNKTMDELLKEPNRTDFANITKASSTKEKVLSSFEKIIDTVNKTLKSTQNNLKNFSKWTPRNKSFLPNKNMVEKKEFSVPPVLSEMNNSNLSTIFCPSGFAYNPDSNNLPNATETEIPKGKTDVEDFFTESKFIQIVVPKERFNQMIVINEQGLPVEKQNILAVPFQGTQENTNIEMWCQLHFVREISTSSIL